MGVSEGKKFHLHQINSLKLYLTKFVAGASVMAQLANPTSVLTGIPYGCL